MVFGRRRRKGHATEALSPEEIIAKLREAEVLLAQGKKVPEVCKSLGVSEVSYYRWRKEYGGLNVSQAKRMKELEVENLRLASRGLRPHTRQAHLEGSRTGKLLSPSRRRRCVDAVCEGLAISQRRVCRVLGQYRSSQRHQPQILQDEDALTAAIVVLARRFGRYGYRRVTDLLHMAGWEVNAKRVQRIWRAEGLKVPAKQPKRGRLWLADGSCIRLRPERRNHVWPMTS